MCNPGMHHKKCEENHYPNGNATTHRATIANARLTVIHHIDYGIKGCLLVFLECSFYFVCIALAQIG